MCLGTYSSHVFTNPEFSICNCFLREKNFYNARKITVILTFYNLFPFLCENPFRTDQSKQQISWGKNSVFVDSGFVKTCNELVIDSKRWNSVVF